MRSFGLSSTLAMNNPMAKEISTVDAAKMTVHTNARRKGWRTIGLVTTAVKFSNPMYSRQPTTSCSPCAFSNEPRPLSANESPVSVATNTSRAGSYSKPGAES